MDQAAAERKVGEAVGKKFGRSPDEQKDRIVAGSACEQVLWNHAVSLQSQLSASEERVRKLTSELADMKDDLKEIRRGGMSWEDACGSNPDHEF